VREEMAREIDALKAALDASKAKKT
jgi:hypothetical protein